MSLCDIVPFGQLSLRLCTGATVTRDSSRGPKLLWFVSQKEGSLRTLSELFVKTESDRMQKPE